MSHLYRTVVGVDPSLTGTGVAHVELREDGSHSTQLVTAKSKPAKGREPAASVIRMGKLMDQVWPHSSQADLVVMEGPSFGSTGGTAHERAGYWWKLADAFTHAGIPILVVPPSTVKMYVLNNGGAKKNEVMASMIKRHLDLTIANDNEADALALASLGCRLDGHEIDEIPQAHIRGKWFKELVWPPTII